MNWTSLAFSATFLVAAGSLFEKVLVSRRLPSAAVFLGWFALSTLPHAVVFAFVFPVPEATPARHVAVMLVAGVSWGMAANLMYRVLRTAEVSRVWPVVNVSPVFVGILSLLFLSERLSGWQWGAMLVAVSGTILISFQRGAAGKGFSFDRSFFTLVGASFFMASGQVMQKYALGELEPLTGFWLLRFGMFIGLSVNLLTRGTVKGLVASARDPRTLGIVVLTEFVIFPAAVLLIVWATSVGPVSLVATVIGTVPVWLFVMSSLLSTKWWNVMHEPLRRETLAQKTVSIALIVAGITGIALL
ncbi:MAG: DMT family transporter [SAR202 cluster bacterium]|nr:DMT family transporter [SAR202 cluster bacterium]